MFKILAALFFALFATSAYAQEQAPKIDLKLERSLSVEDKFISVSCDTNAMLQAIAETEKDVKSKEKYEFGYNLCMKARSYNKELQEANVEIASLKKEIEELKRKPEPKVAEVLQPVAVAGPEPQVLAPVVMTMQSPLNVAHVPMPRPRPTLDASGKPVQVKKPATNLVGPKPFNQYSATSPIPVRAQSQQPQRLYMN